MIAREECTQDLGWTHDLPIVSGWYSVLWTGDDDDIPQAVILRPYATHVSWAYSESDDPESYSADNSERPYAIRLLAPVPALTA